MNRVNKISVDDLRKRLMFNVKVEQLERELESLRKIKDRLQQNLIYFKKQPCNCVIEMWELTKIIEDILREDT